MSRVRVKICGLARADDVALACAAGADAIGLVLAPSPRRVTPEAARRLLAGVAPRIERVAVLGRADTAALRAALALGFDLVQAEVAGPLPEDLRARLVPVLRDGPDLLERLEREPRTEAAPGSLAGTVALDGPRGGGRGQPVDRARAAAAARDRAIVLAGGLHPGNVAALVREVRPCAVDVSSGIEHWPGVKSARLVHAFLAAVRAADPRPVPHDR